MKKNTLITFSLVFGLLLFLFACRKDIEYYIKDREQPSSSRVESAKIWRLQHINKSGRQSRTVLQPHWDHSWLVKRAKGAQVLVVPATERAVANRKFNIRRFFVFSLSGNMVSDGRIVEILGENYNVDDHLDPLLESLDRDQITGFNGAVYNYDIDYNFLSSDVYKDGAKTNMRSKIITSSGGNLKIADVVTASADCDYITPIRIGYPASFCAGASVAERIDYVYDEDGCLYFASFTYISHTCPGQGGGSGSGGNGSGSGSGTGGDSPPYGGPGGTGNPQPGTAISPLEIIDELVNQCLKAALATTLNSQINGKISEILNHLGKNSKVKVRVGEVESISNGAPANTNGGVFTNYPDGTKLYDVKISLNKQLLVDTAYNMTSKEFAVGVIIHEALHAYFRSTTGITDINNSDHQNIANNYIKPMAQYLSDLFEISLVDASSIAWRGVRDSNAYKDATSFDVGEGANKVTVTKENMEALGTQYYINQKGTGICQ